MGDTQNEFNLDDEFHDVGLPLTVRGISSRFSGAANAPLGRVPGVDLNAKLER